VIPYSKVISDLDRLLAGLELEKTGHLADVKFKSGLFKQDLPEQKHKKHDSIITLQVICQRRH
jgi:hypothetical protein